MISKEKLITVGTEKLADILLSLYKSNKEIKKQLDIIFAGLDKDPKKIASVIKKEISSLKRSTKFIDYYESNSLVNCLDQLRLRIVNDAHTKSPKIAFTLMLEFLDLHETIINRVDDSNGSVSSGFMSACEDLDKISENVQIPLSQYFSVARLHD